MIWWPLMHKGQSCEFCKTRPLTIDPGLSVDALQQCASSMRFIDALSSRLSLDTLPRRSPLTLLLDALP